MTLPFATILIPSDVEGWPQQRLRPPSFDGLRMRIWGPGRLGELPGRVA